MTNSVTTQIERSVHVIGMDDLRVNALTLEVIDELIAALDAAQDAGAVVLAGRPGCLSAGLDRGTMLGGDRAAASESLRKVTELYERLLHHPAPTVVACTGHALAAGALLLLVADVRIGARTACKIGFNEAQVKLPLAPLGVAAARARLLPSALFQATLQGTVYDAAGALTAGYLDELVDAESVTDAAVQRASQLAALDRRAYLRTRELLWAPALAEVERALARRRAAAGSGGRRA